VAYNYDYDRTVLTKEFGRLGRPFPVRPMIDPFILFKKWNKYNKGKKLTDAAAKYGIQYVGAHRACNDATACGKVLIKMAATRMDFPKSIDKYVIDQRKLVEEQFVDFYEYLQKVGRDLPTPPHYKHYEFPYAG